MNHKMTPIAEIDDLVRITGYENRVFRIASFTHELTHEKGIRYEDIYYDCICVTNGEFALGAQEDITIVSKAVTAERYLEAFEHPEVSDVSPMDIFELLGMWTAEVFYRKNVLKIPYRKLASIGTYDAEEWEWDFAAIAKEEVRVCEEFKAEKRRIKRNMNEGVAAFEIWDGKC